MKLHGKFPFISFRIYHDNESGNNKDRKIGGQISGAKNKHGKKKITALCSGKTY